MDLGLFSTINSKEFVGLQGFELPVCAGRVGLHLLVLGSSLSPPQIHFCFFTTKKLANPEGAHKLQTFSSVGSCGMCQCLDSDNNSCCLLLLECGSEGNCSPRKWFLTVCNSLFSSFCFISVQDNEIMWELCPNSTVQSCFFLLFVSQWCFLLYLSEHF